ncbi:tight junction protein ZO-3, partial [Asbolus verrucosus]
QMKWFRKQGEAPRLLSLSPLRTSESEQTTNLEILTPPKHVKRRSRLEMSPAVWARRQNKNDTNFYNVEDSVIIIEKSDRRRYKSQPRSLRTSCIGISDSGHYREKRNPLLDRVKHTRLSCFRSNSNASTIVDVPSCSSVSKNCSDNDAQSSDSQSLDLELLGVCSSDKQYDSLSRASCFTAKLRAMSEKYLQSSTNKFLNKIYKSQPGPLAESTPVKNPRRKKNIRTKLRSFSYGALPGLEEFQKTHEPLCQEPDRDILDDEDERLLLVDNEDCDSGIIINDSGLSSGLDSDTFKTDSQNNSLLEFKTHDTEINRSSNRRNHPQRALSLDRREFRNIYHHMDNKNETISETPTILIQLVKQNADDELGIFLTKSKDIFHGFFVAHIVPDGVAARQPGLMIGDEIISINGRDLSGLNMAEAKQSLCTSNLHVDLLVSRKHETKSMKESFVDFDSRHSEITSSPLYKRQHYFQKNSSSHGSYNKVLKRVTVGSNSSNQSKNNETPFPSSPQSQDYDPNTEKFEKQEHNLNTTTNFCTLPRRPRSTICTFHTVILEKGPGKKSLGFTIPMGKQQKMVDSKQVTKFWRSTVKYAMTYLTLTPFFFSKVLKTDQSHYTFAGGINQNR